MIILHRIHILLQSMQTSLEIGDILSLLNCFRVPPGYLIPECSYGFLLQLDVLFQIFILGLKFVGNLKVGALTLQVRFLVGNFSVECFVFGY